MKSEKTIYDFNDYRAYLREYLANCQSRNSSFSLRSYAKKLGVTPSYLSEILSGKKNLSLAKASGFAEKLGFDSQAQQYFFDLVQGQDQKNKGALNLIQERVKNTHRPNKRTKIEKAQFDMLSLWYLIPVFEMVTNNNYGDDLQKIGLILGLSATQVDEAVTHLANLKVIEKNKDNQWSRTSKNLVLSSEQHNQALKKFHSNLIEKYQRALFDQGPQERYTGSETLLIDPSQIPEAHKIMNECLDRLVTLFNSSLERTEPYHLHFAMFSLRRKIISSREEAS